MVYSWNREPGNEEESRSCPPKSYPGLLVAFTLRSLPSYSLADSPILLKACLSVCPSLPDTTPSALICATPAPAPHSTSPDRLIPRTGSRRRRSTLRWAAPAAEVLARS